MDLELREFLLLPKEVTGREQKEAYLYRPYSPKLGRRLNLYGHLAYDHWATVESDKNIETFNELPHAIDIPVNGRVHRSKPSMVCQYADGVLELRLLRESFPEVEEELTYLQGWGSAHEVVIKLVDSVQLRANSLRLANLKVMLRYLESCREDIVPSLMSDIVNVVQHAGPIRISSLIDRLVEIDETVVVACIAQAILNDQIDGDIDKHIFDKALRLGAS